MTSLHFYLFSCNFIVVKCNFSVNVLFRACDIQKLRCDVCRPSTRCSVDVQRCAEQTRVSEHCLQWFTRQLLSRPCQWRQPWDECFEGRYTAVFTIAVKRHEPMVGSRYWLSNKNQQSGFHQQRRCLGYSVIINTLLYIIAGLVDV